jgi:CheY-like chemotaxis protein
MQPNGKRIGVLLADDATIIRQAVIRLLEEEPRVKVLGEAANFSLAVFLALALKPDVVLLDLHMPDDNSFEPAFVKSLFQLSGVSRMRAGSLGAVTLLDKAEFGHELIPAILRL